MTKKEVVRGREVSVEDRSSIERAVHRIVEKPTDRAATKELGKATQRVITTRPTREKK